MCEQRELIAMGTVRAASPADLVKSAQTAAKTLADVIRHGKLSVSIQGKEFVKCEGWTTLATMMGVVPREVEVSEIDAENGTRYVARVALVRMSDGIVISEASAECGTDEPRWAQRPRYARRSMAVTRATSKACRLAFSWVMTLAGYEPTPAEEIIDVKDAQIVMQPATTTESRPASKDGKISKAQAKRLWALAYDAARNAGLATETAENLVREFLEAHGLQSTTDIERADYEDFCKMVVEEIKNAVDF